MKRLFTAILKQIRGLTAAVERFPWAVFCLFLATGLTCYMISLSKSPELIIQKLMFVFLLGSFIGVTAQFACERFARLERSRLAVYVLAALATGAYYAIISPMPAIDYGVGARTTVAAFSMFCAFIWLPSSGKKVDFNNVALVHFKSAFTAILYAGVLSLGLASIIAAVNILLFKVDSDCYGYMMALVWILFAPTYYLSLLPRFNSSSKADRAYAQQVSQNPRFLEILISYIAIPLVAAYTLVLLAYFIKIGVTRTWPSGQLGPMILAYASAGLIIYVLASGLQNKWAALYQLLFPKLLIPIVVMQLISVYIRLQAYGVTESRYYVALFGIYSIFVGIALSVKPVKANGVIALLAAGFAIISVLPPVDAFTISRNSQIARLENYLIEGGLLAQGELNPDSDADMNLRVEITSIVNYLYRRNYLTELAWIPEDFSPYRDMQTVFGFESTYPHNKDSRHAFVHLDMQWPLDISGYDAIIEAGTYRGKYETEITTYDLTIEGIPYKLKLEPLPSNDLRVSLQSADGENLILVDIYEFASTIAPSGSQSRAMNVEDLTLDQNKDQYRLRIIFQHIAITYDESNRGELDASMYILVGVRS